MQEKPKRAQAAAVCRQWLDWTAPVVMTVCAPFARASASKYSNLRILLPPNAKPVRSSRLTKRVGPPSSAVSLGRASTGVGR